MKRKMIAAALAGMMMTAAASADETQTSNLTCKGTGKNGAKVTVQTDGLDLIISDSKDPVLQERAKVDEDANFVHKNEMLVFAYGTKTHREYIFTMIDNTDQASISFQDGQFAMLKCSATIHKKM